MRCVPSVRGAGGASRILAAALAALGAGLAGCGSGEQTTASEPGTRVTGSTVSHEVERAISKAALIKRGDAICRRTDRIQTARLKAYTKKHPNAESTEAKLEKTVVQVALPPIRTELRELRGLGSPRGDEVEVRAIITGIQGALDAAKKDPGLLLDSGEDPFVPTGRSAANYGFKDCSSPG